MMMMMMMVTMVVSIMASDVCVLEPSTFEKALATHHPPPQTLATNLKPHLRGGPATSGHDRYER